MRRNYYDSDWRLVQEEAKPSPAPSAAPEPPPEPPREPEPAPEPPAPAAPEAPAGRRTPELRRVKQPKPKPKPKEKRRSGVWVAVVFLVLLVGLTVGGIFLQGGLPETNLLWQLPQIWQDWQNWQNGQYQEDWDGKWSQDWTASLLDTSIERAPIGEDLSVPLALESEEALTPGEIYARVSPSIVGVRMMGYDRGATGTGIVLSSDGYILTNAHVIAGGAWADVLLPSGRRAEARLVGYDMSSDLAVLKVEAQGLTPAVFGDSDALRVGDAAYAIGNPMGEEFRGTMTDGIISAIDRSVSSYNGTMSLVQTTAALNSGNSGGALCNAAGQVIGITNMKIMSSDETIEGLGFAIPSTLAREVAEQIVRQGFFEGLPMLGITVINHFGSSGENDGAEVAFLVTGSDAWRQGVLVGDVVVEANGAPVTCVNDLLQAKKGLGVGDTLELKLLRYGEPIEVTVALMTQMQMDIQAGIAG